jgi:hypothetical protein
MTHGPQACRRTADSGRPSWSRFHFAVHLGGVGEGGRARIRMQHGVRLYHAWELFLIAFAGNSHRSQSTGKPFNVGIQAEESFSCRRLESRLTSNASLWASNDACVLLTRVVRTMRGPRNLPPTDGRSAENKGDRMTIKCVIRQRPAAAAVRRGIGGIDTSPKLKLNKIASLFCRISIQPGSHYALITASQVVSPRSN